MDANLFFRKSRKKQLKRKDFEYIKAFILLQEMDALYYIIKILVKQQAFHLKILLNLNYSTK